MKIDVNKVVSASLATGVAVSFVFLLVGIIIYLIHPQAYGSHGSIPDMICGAAHLKPSALLNIGLIVLIITPIVRVIAALFAFAVDGERKYAIISAAILVILSISAFLGGK